MVRVKKKVTVRKPQSPKPKPRPRRTGWRSPLKILRNKTPVDDYYLGEILIGTTNNLLPNEWEKCAVMTSSLNESGLSLLFDDLCTVVVQVMIERDILTDIFRTFHIGFRKDTGDDLYIRLYFHKLPFDTFNKKVGNTMKIVFSLLYNISTDEEASDNEECAEQRLQATGIAQLYKDISRLHKENPVPSVANLQHPQLKPALRKYQEDAVSWMLFREQQSSKNTDIVHPLYTEVTLKSGLTIYYDKFSGYVEPVKPLVESFNNGGILADEMGLGKTVEVLACILGHKKNSASEISPSSSSSDEDDDDFIVSSSKSQRRSRKRISREKNTEEESDKVKKLKVPDEWVKAPKEKSQLRVALETWYEQKLNEVKLKAVERRESKEFGVQCVCGETNEDNCVKCLDCHKAQHTVCMKYKYSYGPYRCPQCWMEQEPLESGATLIVCPMSLRKQWHKEILKHVRGDFKVFVYDGFRITPVYPTKLAKYDVVITTYKVLQMEFQLTHSSSELSFRHQRRYGAPGCPLTNVNWWRLCLDEAQMVDRPTCLISEMAQKLTAQFRWAVTGTPISNEISDLHGLINYLQIKPYNDAATWKHILYEPYLKGNKKPMYDFLQQVMWRTCKSDVLDQISIPKQTFEEHWLQFSAVEKYFYKREHELSSESFLAKAKGYSDSLVLSSLDRMSLKNILAPLLYIRQACSHPNTIRGRYLATRKQVSSMKELLDALILKTTTECEESLRLVISALNGLAGIYLLLFHPEEASDEYRKVLQLAARYEGYGAQEFKLAVDKLQLIHTMHNLAELIESCPHVKPACRDSELRNDCLKVEEKYIEKFTNQSIAAYKESAAASLNVAKLQEKFILNPGQWFSDMMEWISIGDYFDELLNKIRTIHETSNVTWDMNATSERTILFILGTWDDQVSAFRENCFNKINNLYKISDDESCQISIDPQLVQKVTKCHLRPEKKSKKTEKCPVCEANVYLKKYESKLFSMQNRTETFEEMSLKGSWKPSSQELILKSLLSLGKSKNVNPDIIKDGENHIHLLDALKKEFKDVRKFWTHLDQQICAQDEVEMCKMRLTLKEPSEEHTVKKDPTKEILKRLSYVFENKLETHHMINEHELEYQKAVLQNEETQGLNNLEKNLGILKYLQTLRKQQYEGQSPDPCPICQNALEGHWSILPCGHSYCVECINSLFEGKHGCSGQYMQCSVCREKQKIVDISYIKADNVADAQDTVKIAGNYSTKIEAIVALLLNLKKSDPQVKVLVFSVWNKVLQTLKDALEKNGIGVEYVGKSKLEQKIENFKDPSKKINALLLTVNLGGKGLNLIEATHVVLVEPFLNPADELQAIGRVHRIGQTKPTFVHRFFIRNTIEDNIQQAMRDNVEKWDKNKVTLGQLVQLFFPTEKVTINSEAVAMNDDREQDT